MYTPLFSSVGVHAWCDLCRPSRGHLPAPLASARKSQCGRKLSSSLFQVFQNLQDFMKDKDPRDDLFDALTVSLHDGHKRSKKGGGTQVWLAFFPVCSLL